MKYLTVDFYFFILRRISEVILPTSVTISSKSKYYLEGNLSDISNE